MKRVYIVTTSPNHHMQACMDPGHINLCFVTVLLSVVSELSEVRVNS